ncbi:hypothetical protein NDU88_006997 [Pleurodeles waltl]|uniref:Uncharacterized protein n=1 Tax=Pleurodeles waltl TaxID=8319 RepID=A0AAV7QKF6_PLEWA|nr:hypothetical protein NDU88_006997 [Pleurodeles waltl]
MAQGRSNTSTFLNAPISSTGRPRYLRDSFMVHSLSPVHTPPHSVLGTFGPKMAAATSKVRLIDSRRRPSVSVRRSAVQMSPLLPPSGVPHLVGVVRTFRQRPALRAAARDPWRPRSVAAARPRDPTSQAARGRSSSSAPAGSPGQLINAGTFSVPAPPRLWCCRRHTPPARVRAPPPAGSVRRRRRLRSQAALSANSTQAIK